MNHWIVVIAVLIVYLLPTIIAFNRGHASKMAIVLMNVLLGWTLVVWFVCLIWALSNKGANQTVIVNNYK